MRLRQTVKDVIVLEDAPGALSDTACTCEHRRRGVEDLARVQMASSMASALEIILANLKSSFCCNMSLILATQIPMRIFIMAEI